MSPRKTSTKKMSTKKTPTRNSKTCGKRRHRNRVTKRCRCRKVCGPV